MAIVSLIAGILGLTFIPLIGSIVAVITGPMAKKEIRGSRGALGGEGLATAGVILGWIGIVLTVLGLCIAGVAILLPLLLIAIGVSSESGLILPTIFALI
jgi:hypothetical protein